MGHPGLIVVILWTPRNFNQRVAMNPTSTAIVEISPLEQFQYFLSHEPPILGLVLAYATICALLFWATRGKGYLISFVTAWLYLVPFWVH